MKAGSAQVGYSARFPLTHVGIGLLTLYLISVRDIVPVTVPIARRLQPLHPLRADWRHPQHLLPFHGVPLTERALPRLPHRPQALRPRLQGLSADWRRLRRDVVLLPGAVLDQRPRKTWREVGGPLRGKA